MVTGFAWGLAWGVAAGYFAGYVVAKVLGAVGAVRSARREANRKLAEARQSEVIERGGHPSEQEFTKASLPKVPPGPGPGSDVGWTSSGARERHGR